tara:strand:- start:459 stop:764 length:306 start_codon:yes stop_codon:yes gene_type:complete
MKERENTWSIIREGHKEWREERRERNRTKMQKWLDRNNIGYALMLELGKSSLWKDGHLIGYISMATNVNEPINVRLESGRWQKMRKPDFIKYYKNLKPNNQ